MTRSRVGRQREETARVPDRERLLEAQACDRRWPEIFREKAATGGTNAMVAVFFLKAEE
jgi:hypothetical protein